jgi:hypothetical protein
MYCTDSFSQVVSAHGWLKQGGRTRQDTGLMVSADAPGALTDAVFLRVTGPEAGDAPGRRFLGFSARWSFESANYLASVNAAEYGVTSLRSTGSFLR